jgi:hypothetical protein
LAQSDRGGRSRRWPLALVVGLVAAWHVARGRQGFELSGGHGALVTVFGWLVLAWTAVPVVSGAGRLASRRQVALLGAGGLVLVAVSVATTPWPSRTDAHIAPATPAIDAAEPSACERSGVPHDDGHGGRGPAPAMPMSSSDRDRYRVEATLASGAVVRFATVQDALAGGYRRTTPYVPCIGAHYLKDGALGNPFDPAEPEVLLYDGTEPDSRIVGLSYMQVSDPGTAPEGFTGPIDQWHAHRELCLAEDATVIVGPGTTTAAGCEQRGGRMTALDHLWNLHMWNVLEWQNRWGLFSSDHPDLGGSVGDIDGP